MFRSARFLPATLALAVAIAVAGCSKSADSVAPPALDQEMADQIAQHVGMVLAAGTGGSMLSLTVIAATLPAGAVTAQDGARPARDTLFAAGGVAWSVADTFFTAGGTPQEDYGALSASASVRALGAGQILRPTFRALFSHLARLQTSGLSSVRDTIEWAGTARDSTRSWFTAKFSGATCRLMCVASIAHDGITVLKAQDPLAAPLGGVSTWSVDAARFDNADTTRVERQATTTVLVGFDGTGRAVLQVGGLYEYQVDLSTGDLTRYGAWMATAR